MERFPVLLVGLTAFLISLVSCGDNNKTVDEKTEEAKEQGTVKQSSLEELGASFILALKENDSTMLSDLIPVKEDVEQIVSIYAGSEKEKKNILTGSEENTKNIRENTYKAFSDIRRKGNKIGINWEEVTFSNAEYINKKENNIETTNLTLLFGYKDAKYKIHISECIKTERGWIIFDKPQWKN